MLFLQMVVEKMLEGQGRRRQDIGREAFTQEVWKWKEQYGGFISQQMRSLGASCDWSRERFTLDNQLSGMTHMTSCQILSHLQLISSHITSIAKAKTSCPAQWALGSSIGEHAAVC